MIPTKKIILENIEEMLAAYIEGNLSEQEEAIVDGILSEDSSLNDMFLEACQDIVDTVNNEEIVDSLDANEADIIDYDDFNIEALLKDLPDTNEIDADIESFKHEDLPLSIIDETVVSNHIDNPLQIGETPEGTFSAYVKQGYSDTCAIMSQKIILDAYGIHYTEDELREQAKELGLYTEGQGTSINDMGKLLIHNNCPCTNYIGGNIADIVKAFSEGKMVMMAVDSGELWRTGFLGRLWEKLEDKIPFIGGPDHALLVTGIDASDPEHVMVIVTDPGSGELNKPYPIEQFIDAAKDSNFFMTVTDTPRPNVFEAYHVPEMTHLTKIGDLSYHEFIENFSQYFSKADSLGLSLPSNVVEDLYALIIGEEVPINNNDASTDEMITPEVLDNISTGESTDGINNGANLDNSDCGFLNDESLEIEKDHKIVKDDDSLSESDGKTLHKGELLQSGERFNENVMGMRTFGYKPNYELDTFDPNIYQGYSNTCAIRSQEIILRDYGIMIPQEELMQYAEHKGWFNPDPEEGGTDPRFAGNLIDDCGIKTIRKYDADIFDIIGELRAGHRVMVGVDSKELWLRNEPNVIKRLFQNVVNHGKDIIQDANDIDGATHALIVAGVRVNPSDPSDIHVTIIDPGTGEMCVEYTFKEFENAWEDSHHYMVATTIPAPFQYNSETHLMEPSGFYTDYIPSMQEIPQELTNIFKLSDEYYDIFEKFEPIYDKDFMIPELSDDNHTNESHISEFTQDEPYSLNDSITDDEIDTVPYTYPVDDSEPYMFQGFDEDASKDTFLDINQEPDSSHDTDHFSDFDTGE